MAIDLKMPKVNYKLKFKFKINLNLILLAVTLVILGFESYFAYQNLYAKLVVGTITSQNDKIVRVDTNSYKTTVNFLDSLDNFSPNLPPPANPNPFK